MLVGLGVSDDEKSGLLELLGELVGKGSGDPPGGGTGGASSVLAELVDGSLPVLLSTDDDDFVEIGDGSNDSCGELDLLIGLVDLEDVVAYTVLLLHILLHVVVDFTGSEVDLRGKAYTLAERSLRISFCSLSLLIATDILYLSIF